MNYQRLPKLLLWFVFMTTTIVASAQEKVVSGKVRDQQSNAPMHGVSVKVKGASTGTSTNESGDFIIKFLQIHLFLFLVTSAI